MTDPTVVSYGFGKTTVGTILVATSDKRGRIHAYRRQQRELVHRRDDKAGQATINRIVHRQNW